MGGKAWLEQTAITFKHATNPAWPTAETQYYYEVYAGTATSVNLLGFIYPESYGSDTTKCTTFDLETIVALTADSVVRQTSGNEYVSLTLTSKDGKKIWEMAGGIECKPSSSEKFSNGFLITMAWLVFIVSFIKAYWLTSKWTLLMKNKDYFRAKGASLAAR